VKRRTSFSAAVRRWAPLAVLVPAVAAAAACGGNSSAQRAQTLRLTEKDFAISAPKRFRAGEVRVVAENEGPDAHELLLVRDDGRPLPLRSDGLTVDEEAIEPRIVTTIEGYAPGTDESVVLHLRPGRYTLLCNMAGHYLGGMHRELVVG